MSTHNTHYATSEKFLDQVRPIFGPVFYSVRYSRQAEVGSPSWLCKNRRLSFHRESAFHFSSLADARNYCKIDFFKGLADVVSFVYVHSLGDYVSCRVYHVNESYEVNGL